MNTAKGLAGDLIPAGTDAAAGGKSELRSSCETQSERSLGQREKESREAPEREREREPCCSQGVQLQRKEPAKNGNSGAGALPANEMQGGTMQLLVSPLLHRP